ncbi:hypothetical protein HYDPIDRAFT_33540 [Hydnomerulius pinastri MD-312]|uniref:Unplaced genomic scaffold scaffold_64, whole genome shotgun sequence n=1 Tax=Hydnomerulius pinastri MD-312 TaxID=994086 RepID=A0A0C9V1G3_9AGAM|nr:hypothetical protein HYDPIDRAFT_33540 [Hydnomerulius pinastri MD-312]
MENSKRETASVYHKIMEVFPKVQIPKPSQGPFNPSPISSVPSSISMTSIYDEIMNVLPKTEIPSSVLSRTPPSISMTYDQVMSALSATNVPPPRSSAVSSPIGSFLPAPASISYEDIMKKLSLVDMPLVGPLSSQSSQVTPEMDKHFKAITEQCFDLYHASNHDLEDGDVPDSSDSVHSEYVPDGVHGHSTPEGSDGIPDANAGIGSDATPSTEHIIMCAMARPTAWAEAYYNIPTLKHGAWVDGAVINFYLMSRWYAVQGRTHVRWVDLISAQLSFGEHNVYQPPSEEEISLFRMRHLVHASSFDPSVPVALVVMHGQHYFVAVFDYLAATAYVLGRRISGVGTLPEPYYDPELDDWNLWRGPHYWARVATLHGHNAGDVTNVDVIVRNWAQNGFDCGPIACFVLESLMNNGMNQNNGPSVHIPTIPCGHQLRLNMFYHVKEACRRSWIDYRYLLMAELPPNDIWMQPEWNNIDAIDENALREMERDPSGEQHASIERDINICMANCTKCHRPLLTDIRESSESAPTSDARGQDRPDTLKSATQHTQEEHSRPYVQVQSSRLNDRSKRLKDLLSRYPYVNLARDREAALPHAVGGRKEICTSDEEDTSQLESGDENAREQQNNSRNTRKNAYKGQRWRDPNPSFDEYEGGPSLESLRMDWNFRDFEQSYYPSGVWTAFRDYGYRIRPSFNQMFYLCPPVRVVDHILCVGLVHKGPTPRGQVGSQVTGNYSLSRAPFLRYMDSERGQEVEVNDVAIMGAAEMLALGTAGSDTCFNAFVCGRHQGCHIFLDLERDGVHLGIQNVKISVDIDSFIWVTHQLRCHSSSMIAVHQAPLIINKEAPIRKNNHIYLDILIPQSEEDKEQPGGRTEWLSMPFPLSGTPHVRFGTLGYQSSVNVYICFPRMIHKDERTKQRASMVPKVIQDFFWDHVLLPAIEENSKCSLKPYLASSVKEANFKSRKGVKKADVGAAKSIPLSDDMLCKVQASMKEIIREDPQRFAHFGSFFFVVEGKGIKLWTTSESPKVSPFQMLQDRFPALDWTRMMDRDYGELYMDIGISFHPNIDQDLVGLWRLEAVEASFGAAGFNLGTIHHACTLGRYGGLQAQMSQKRTKQTHICFRSSYNLFYEIIRPNNNTPTFVPDKDAYQLSEFFMKECAAMVSMYRGKAKGRSFGVRDEYRLGGIAAVEVLSDLTRLAKRYLLSEPILWIPTNVWLDFLAMRIKGLQKAQITFKQLNPLNLGIFTGIICYLIRCVTGTPIQMEKHNRKSMSRLQFRDVCERFGMFFLVDLNLHRKPYLPNVQGRDDLEVLRVVGGIIKIGKKARSIRPTLALEEEEEGTFPIGRMPTWQELVKAIREKPWQVMKAWEWNPSFVYLEARVGSLFIKFTCQLWMHLQPSWFADSSADAIPQPDSLEQAILCWSIGSVYKTLVNCFFEACNAQLPGSASIPGRPQSSFEERVGIFFPDPHQSSPPSSKSSWMCFWKKPGYIAEYHEMVKNMPEKELEILKELKKIFVSLQCLPVAMRSTKKTSGQTWTVKLGKLRIATNPLFYRIEGLSGEPSQPRKRQRGARAIKSNKAFHMDLLQISGYDEVLARNALAQERRALNNIRQRRSARSKNVRKPPPPRKKSLVQAPQRDSVIPSPPPPSRAKADDAVASRNIQDKGDMDMDIEMDYNDSEDEDEEDEDGENEDEYGDGDMEDDDDDEGEEDEVVYMDDS